MEFCTEWFGGSGRGGRPASVAPTPATRQAAAFGSSVLKWPGLPSTVLNEPNCCSYTSMRQAVAFASAPRTGAPKLPDGLAFWVPTCCRVGLPHAARWLNAADPCPAAAHRAAEGRGHFLHRRGETAACLPACLPACLCCCGAAPPSSLGVLLLAAAVWLALLCSPICTRTEI